MISSVSAPHFNCRSSFTLVLRQNGALTGKGSFIPYFTIIFKQVIIFYYVLFL